jgi:hypothetical protein
MTVDPELVGYATTCDAVTRLAAEISDRELPRRILPDALDWRPAGEWPSDDLEKAKRAIARSTANSYKREMAVLEIYRAFCHDDLAAIVRDSLSGEKFKITPLDWRGAALWRQTLIGGVVAASAGEHIGRYVGRLVQIKVEALDRWLKDRPGSGRIAAAEDCLSWLKAEMLANSERSPRAKPSYFAEAVERFGVTRRNFDRLWAQAKQETGANWKKGRRKKLQQ